MFCALAYRLPPRMSWSRRFDLPTVSLGEVQRFLDLLFGMTRPTCHVDKLQRPRCHLSTAPDKPQFTGVIEDSGVGFPPMSLLPSTSRPSRRLRVDQLDFSPVNRPGCGPGAGGALERPLLRIENLLLHLDEAGVPKFADELGHLFVVP